MGRPPKDPALAGADVRDGDPLQMRVAAELANLVSEQNVDVGIAGFPECATTESRLGMYRLDPQGQWWSHVWLEDMEPSPRERPADDLPARGDAIVAFGRSSRTAGAPDVVAAFRRALRGGDHHVYGDTADVAELGTGGDGRVDRGMRRGVPITVHAFPHRYEVTAAARPRGTARGLAP